MTGMLSRIFLVLAATAAYLGAASILGDGFNDPKVPCEATLCVILFVLLSFAFGNLLYKLLKKWEGKNEETK